MVNPFSAHPDPPYFTILLSCYEGECQPFQFSTVIPNDSAPKIKLSMAIFCHLIDSYKSGCYIYEDWVPVFIKGKLIFS